VAQACVSTESNCRESRHSTGIHRQYQWNREMDHLHKLEHTAKHEQLFFFFFSIRESFITSNLRKQRNQKQIPHSSYIQSED
jgi:hypothetical protein